MQNYYCYKCYFDKFQCENHALEIRNGREGRNVEIEIDSERDEKESNEMGTTPKERTRRTSMQCNRLKCLCIRGIRVKSAQILQVVMIMHVKVILTKPFG